MVNFKQIAEDCLAGKLSGTFVTAFGNNWHSSYLQRYAILGHEMSEQYVLGPGVIYNKLGQCESRKEVKIIDFIPDMKKQQIIIDIPEGMSVIREEAPGEIKIKLVENELTYDDIMENMDPALCILPFTTPGSNMVNDAFFDKVNVIRKLTNIRNYFGGDKPTNSWLITIDSARRPYVINNPKLYRETCFIYFDTKEHAQAAINMLGDELKYLFEPW